MTSPRWPVGTRRVGVAALAVIVGVVLVGAVAPSALAADFTWSGLTPNSGPSANWSNGTNWVGGTAPSGSVGTLSFPAMTSSACTANPPSASCYTGHNDLTGASANQISIDDGAPYSIDGNAITLGAGGISAAPSASDTGSGSPAFDFPITLGAAQTWSITSGSQNQQLGVANVTGSTETLAINFVGQQLQLAGLNLGGTNEVGAFTASGNGNVSLSGSLNATDGHLVSFTNGAGLAATPSSTANSTGPISMSGGQIQVGDGLVTPTQPDALLAVHGTVGLDSTSVLTEYLDQAGTTPGADYTQLSATGNVSLGGAQLTLADGDNLSGVSGASEACAVLHPGDVYTLVTTSGSLSGTFQGISDGAVIPLSFCPTGIGSGTLPTVRINYTANRVTATVVTSGSSSGVPANTSRPTISGATRAGQSVTESHGAWTNNPTSFGYQWQICDSSGSNCSPISGATSQIYTLTAADVCHTITVQETATNANGSGDPATSTATSVVQAVGSDHTWTGASGYDEWSRPTNWAGCAPPSGTVGTLSFPAAPCPPHCDPIDDISGVTASNLDIASTNRYAYTFGAWGGAALTLTSGLASTGVGFPAIGIPIILGGPNTWTIDTPIVLYSNLSGSSQPLTINLSGYLALNGASNEVGDVTITGTGVLGGVFALGGGPVNYRPASDLNGTDGHTVTLNDGGALTGAGTIGPLNASAGSYLFLEGHTGVLAVQGAMHLHSGSTIAFDDLSRGSGSPVAGRDYRQLTTTGIASLGGASLELTADCNQPRATTYTLVSASGGVSGTFSAANGAVLQAGRDGAASCSATGATPPDFQINYTAHAVTATVVVPPTAQTGAASAVTQTTASLNGSVNPNGLAVSNCHFDYGTTTTYGSSAPCTQAVGSGLSPVAVSAQLTGLAEGTTYHFRVVAASAAGTSTGADATFATGGSPPACSPGPSGAPNICSASPDHGPVLGGTKISVTGAGFASGDKLCFYVSADVHAGVCASKATVVSSTEIDATTPSLVNAANVGQYYVGIEYCCSGLQTTDYVSTVTYLFFPPPPLPPPAPQACDVFSVGPNACWRVGAGVVANTAANWFASVITSNFKPGRNPDYVLLALGGSVDGVTVTGNAVLTCSGDLWAAPGVSLGPSLPVTAILAAGYIGRPADVAGSRSWGQVDGFVGGLTANASIGPYVGVSFVLSPNAPGPNWGIEYWAGTPQAAIGGAYSEYLLGPNPYLPGIPNLPGPAGSPQPINPTLAGDTCGDITKTRTWQTVVGAVSGAIAVATGGAVTVPLSCPIAGGCTGSATLAVGSPAAAADARVRRGGRRTTVLGKSRFSIPAHAVRNVIIHLNTRGRRLLAAAHGQLTALLSLYETAGGHVVHQTKKVTLEVAPRLSNVKEVPSIWTESPSTTHRSPNGTVFSFTLSEPAGVQLTFITRVHDHSRTMGSLTVTGHPGANRIGFRGVLPRRNQLFAGAYAVTIVATNAAGQHSHSYRLHFRIVR